jgi:hypothetical protein
VLSLCLGLGFAATSAAQEAPEEAASVDADVATSEETRIPIAVLPFRIHSTRPLGYLT